MIPQDREELQALAGEYVLGVLEPEARREVDIASRTNAELAGAVAYWEERLHGLSRLAPPAEPPSWVWERIAEQINASAIAARRVRLWNYLGFWRGATAVAAALAAALALHIALSPRTAAPSFVAVLHAPQQEPALWVATAVGKGLLLRAVANVAAPNDRAFELWAIAPGGGTPKPLGVIPPSGELEIGALPNAMQDGGILAISIEPKGGSPTGLPTGPVVFVGRLNAVKR